MNFLLFRKKTEEDKSLSKKLKEILGFKPRDIEFYKTALRHASAGLINNGKVYNNERLEFVGDAIISAVISDILYRKYPKANEGKLSILRSTIVNRKELNRVACALNINQLLVYKKTMESSMKNMGGNSLEAIVGAVYFDRGYKYCVLFMGKIISNYFDISNIMKKNADYKSKLLQFVQKHKINLIISTTENVEGNEKTQHFLSEVCLDGVFLAEGKGWSKKEAEQIAAMNALKKLKSYKF